MSRRFDFVVVGSGFGGSIMASVLRRIGKSVLLVEKHSHPRFVIGESSTPFANLLLETIAEEFRLPSLRPFCEWGSWQQTYPHIPAGLKRGFTFCHHQRGKPFDFSFVSNRLLVAASPNDQVADTHWYRPAFDQFLVEEPQRLGVEYQDRTSVQVLEAEPRWKLRLEHEDALSEVEADFLIDATGPNSFLSGVMENPEVGFTHFPETAAIYAHFRDVPRSEASCFGPSAHLPYPPDDAAVHHVFDHGWAWVLRFNNGITSAGVACTQTFRDSLPHGPALAWQTFLQEFPTLERLFAGASLASPMFSCERLSFRRAKAAGINWALLPSAAGFVDPLLSTGFALNLLGILRLGRIFREKRTWPDEREDFEHSTFEELDAAADLMSALYAKMDSPDEFNSLTLLYFAAMSFTETAWRLRKTELATAFLLENNSDFRRSRLQICAAARGGEFLSRERVIKAILPFDIAGLSDSSRQNLHGVHLEDLYSGAQKLGVSPEDITAMLRRCGLA